MYRHTKNLMRNLCHKIPLQSSQFDVIHSHVYHTEPMIYRILLEEIEKYINPSHV